MPKRQHSVLGASARHIKPRHVPRGGRRCPLFGEHLHVAVCAAKPQPRQRIGDDAQARVALPAVIPVRGCVAIHGLQKNAPIGAAQGALHLGCQRQRVIHRPLRQHARVHHQHPMGVVCHVLVAQPCEQIGRIGGGQQSAKGVALATGAQTCAYGQGVQIVVAQNAVGSALKLAQTPEHSQRIGATVDHIAQHVQHVAAGRKTQLVEQKLQSAVAALHVTNPIHSHVQIVGHVLRLAAAVVRGTIGRMDVFLIVFLTALNGAFAMSEMALSTCRKARLQLLAESGHKGAGAALALLAQPTRFLSTVQVGITSIGMLNGILGEAAFSAGLGRWLASWGMGEGAASATATAVVVTGITCFTIVFGELVPKRIGQTYPETVASRMALPMTLLARLASPFVRFLSVATQSVLRLLRINTAQAQEVTQEEISASLAEGVTAGLIEAHEHQMVRNVFDLDDRTLASMMSARADIVWLDAQWTPAQALSHIQALPVSQQHAWYPVCRDGLAHVHGVVGLAQLVSHAAQPDVPLAQLALPADFVPETQTGMEFLERLRDQSSRMVFVVDEYGDVQGLLTPLDVLQAITGELKSDIQTEAWAIPQTDGAWALDGRMPVAELGARLNVVDFPGQGRGRYNTLAGLLQFVTGQLPNCGDRIQIGQWTFEVQQLDGRRIDRVMARHIGPTPPLPLNADESVA